tara:strand:+ start:985 stop:1497 length:513 start_codon:yes stop_codon:yes gene_type:complete
MSSLSTIHSQNEVNTSPLGFAISASRNLCWALLTALVLVSLQPAEGFALNGSEGNPGPLNAEITKLRIENIRLKKRLSILEDELAKLASNAAQNMPDSTQAGCDAQKLRALLTNVDGYDKSKLALLWVRENVRRCTTPEIAFLRRELQDWSSYSVAESLMVLEKEYVKRL